MPSGYDPMGGNRFSEKILVKQRLVKQRDEIVIQSDHDLDEGSEVIPRTLSCRSRFNPTPMAFCPTA